MPDQGIRRRKFDSTNICHLGNSPNFAMKKHQWLEEQLQLR
jgi:hypothetical protein